MMNHARVFKKTAPNGKLTVYVEKRELIISENGIETLKGVLFIDPSYVRDRKVYGQFVLTFRYGREDEEVMGLRFCNEACLQANQLWPITDNQKNSPSSLTPLQDTLVKRLGTGAVPFCFVISSLAPPSVTLLPARSYMGAPIGTNYDVRIFVGDCSDDKPHKRSSVRMGIKLAQISSFAPALQPYAANSRQLLLTDGKVSIEASLDKEIYQKDEPVLVSITITNDSSRNVKKIKVIVIQFVDVAMFSNGKFKNVVASLETTEGCPVAPNKSYTNSFKLCPARGVIKNWIALEEFYDRESSLASSVDKPCNGERNVFAIYVNYYVKVKLLTSALGGEVSVKVPFKIMRIVPPSEQRNNEFLCNGRTLKNLPRNVGLPITTSQSLCDIPFFASNNLPRMVTSRGAHSLKFFWETDSPGRSISQPHIKLEDVDLLMDRLKYLFPPCQSTAVDDRVERTVEVITHPENADRVEKGLHRDKSPSSGSRSPIASGARRKNSSAKEFIPKCTDGCSSSKVLTPGTGR